MRAANVLASAAASLAALAGASCARRTGTPPAAPDPWHRGVLATTFWVGEPGNEKSAWDPKWQANFGGVDDPKRRKGWLPASFNPKQNTFYCALPYNDVAGRPNRRSKLKGRWVQVRAGGESCYCQWEDVGPWRTDDKAYVLGGARPRAEQEAKAGLDLSPAVRDYLGLTGKDPVDWRFVRRGEVPEGPWRAVITGPGHRTSNRGK